MGFILLNWFNFILSISSIIDRINPLRKTVSSLSILDKNPFRYYYWSALILCDSKVFFIPGGEMASTGIKKLWLHTESHHLVKGWI